MKLDEGVESDMKRKAKDATIAAAMLLVVSLLASVSCAVKNPISSESMGTSQAVTKAIALTVADGGWNLSIERIIELPNEIWVLARVQRRPGMATQAIMQVSATLPSALPNKPLRVFVAGKTWAWKNDEPYEFVPNLESVMQQAVNARVLFPKN